MVYVHGKYNILCSLQRIINSPHDCFFRKLVTEASCETELLQWGPEVAAEELDEWHKKYRTITRTIVQTEHFLYFFHTNDK